MSRKCVRITKRMEKNPVIECNKIQKKVLSRAVFKV